MIRKKYSEYVNNHSLIGVVPELYKASTKKITTWTKVWLFIKGIRLVKLDIPKDIEFKDFKDLPNMEDK